MPPPDLGLVSSLDAMFLALEEGGMHQHVAVALLFDAGPLRGDDGALDFPRIRAHLAAAARGAPHLLQRLERTPLLDTPIWVDEPDLDLSAHIHRRSAPAPGDDAALKALIAELHGQRLPRGRPLWEITVIDGLAAGRFALLFKIHHVILDGRAGVEALAAFFGLAPAADRPPVDPDHRRPLRLLARELAHRLAAARDLTRWISDEIRRDGRAALITLGRGLYAMARAPLRPASPTPLNPPRVSPRRRVEWRALDLQDARARRRGGATINDVLLAAAAGMLRAYLQGRGHPVAGLDLRATVPVHVERSAGRTNAVIGVIVGLPVDAADPAERLRRVVAETRAIKGAHIGDAMDLVGRLSDLTTHRLYGDLLLACVRRRPATLVVSDIVGPPFPLDLLGAPLREVYPFVPINDTQALAVAIFSYAGRLYIALNADPDVIPDLVPLADAFVAALLDLPLA